MATHARRMVSIAAAILTLFLALAPLALAGTEEGAGDGEDGAGALPPVSLPADLTGTTDSLGGGTPAQSVPVPPTSGTVGSGGGEDDDEGSSSEEPAPSDDSGSEEADDDEDDGDSDDDSRIPAAGGIVRPVALLGLAAAGMILLRRL